MWRKLVLGHVRTISVARQLLPRGGLECTGAFNRWPSLWKAVDSGDRSAILGGALAKLQGIIPPGLGFFGT
jgi:hypothetical protein